MFSWSVELSFCLNLSPTHPFSVFVSARRGSVAATGASPSGSCLDASQPAGNIFTLLPQYTGLGLKPTTILRPSQSHILSSPSHICSMHFLPDRRPQHPWHLTAAFLPTMYSILNLIYRLFHTHIRSQTFHHHLLVHLEQRKDILTMTRHFLPILRLLVPSKHHALLHPDPCPFLLLHPIRITHAQTFAPPNDHAPPPWSSLSIATAPSGGTDCHSSTPCGGPCP